MLEEILTQGRDIIISGQKLHKLVSRDVISSLKYPHNRLIIHSYISLSKIIYDINFSKLVLIVVADIHQFQVLPLAHVARTQ